MQIFNIGFNPDFSTTSLHEKFNIRANIGIKDIIEGNELID